MDYVKYSRAVIVLEEKDREFADKPGTEMKGYLRVETGNNRGAIRCVIQNIKYYPLVLWGMTENDCLIKCYRNGFNWKEGSVDLYDVLERVSCYCCANKNLGECKAMIRYLPQYWQKIKDMEIMIGKPFKDIGTAVIEGKVNDGKNHPGTVFEDVPEQGQNLSS